MPLLAHFPAPRSRGEGSDAQDHRPTLWLTHWVKSRIVTDGKIRSSCSSLSRYQHFLIRHSTTLRRITTSVLYGNSWARRRQHDHDLHSCSESSSREVKSSVATLCDIKRRALCGNRIRDCFCKELTSFFKHTRDLPRVPSCVTWKETPNMTLSENCITEVSALGQL